MFIVSKALLISSATVIVHTGRDIWLSPFATVLFSVCSSVTVECCGLYPFCMGVFGMFAVMYGKMLISSVFAITESRDMGLYDVPLSMSLLGFGMGTMLANFHMCILVCVCYFVVKCYGGVECGWRCSVGYTVYCLPTNVPVIQCASICSFHRFYLLCVCRKYSPHLGI